MVKPWNMRYQKLETTFSIFLPVSFQLLTGPFSAFDRLNGREGLSSFSTELQKDLNSESLRVDVHHSIS